MPEMDGLSTARYIYQHWDAAARPYMIAMTANAMLGDREECLKAGMDDDISKPIHAATLVQALSRCLACSQPVAQPQPDSDAAIDLQVLHTLHTAIGESDDVMTELIDCYLVEALKLMQSMQVAVFTQDPVALNQAAHMLKASSAYLGATTLAKLCKQLEADSRAGSMTRSATNVKQLEAEYERVQTAL